MLSKQSRQRALQIVPILDEAYGGPSLSVPHLADALKRQHIDSVLLSVKTVGDEENPLISNQKLSHVSVSGWKMFNFYYSHRLRSELNHLISGANTTVIHLHGLWSYASYCALKASKRFKVPLVCAPRSDLYPASLARSAWKKQIVWRWYVRNLLHSSACFHATEEGEVHAIKLLNNQMPVALVPNGVDLEPFTNLLSRSAACSLLDLQ